MDPVDQGSAPSALPLVMLVDIVDQALPARLVGLPQLLVGNPLQRLPDFGVFRGMPRGAQIAFKQAGQLGRNPGLEVDAVGDRDDGQLGRGELGPEPAPHLAGNLAVETADRIGVGRETQRQNGHAEGAVVVVRVEPSQSQEFLAGEPEFFAVVAQVGFDQVGGEPVVARGDRGVGGEDIARGAGFARLGKGEVLFLHEGADALERQEGRVAFVHVADAGLDAQGVEGPEPANAEQDLLADAHFPVAAVEVGGDLPVLGAVDFQVGVQQVERHAAHLGGPDLGVDRLLGIGNFDDQRFARGGMQQAEGHLVQVDFRVEFHLPAVRVEGLLEITLTVEQADTDEG